MFLFIQQPKHKHIPHTKRNPEGKLVEEDIVMLAIIASVKKTK